MKLIHIFILFTMVYLHNSKKDTDTLASMATQDLNTCTTTASLGNDSLTTLLEKYVRKVEPNEIPIIVQHTSNDSTVYYVSAFIYTNSIVNNRPTAIYSMHKRDVLFYNESSKKIGTNCQDALIRKYRKILHVDRMNKAQGVPPGPVRYFAYDPVWVKVTTINGQVVAVTEHGDPVQSVPLIDHSF